MLMLVLFHSELFQVVSALVVAMWQIISKVHSFSSGSLLCQNPVYFLVDCRWFCYVLAWSCKI